MASERFGLLGKDTINLILSFLPTEKIIPFKRVNKAWHKLITEREAQEEKELGQLLNVYKEGNALTRRNAERLVVLLVLKTKREGTAFLQQLIKNYVQSLPQDTCYKHKKKEAQELLNALKNTTQKMVLFRRTSSVCLTQFFSQSAPLNSLFYTSHPCFDEIAHKVYEKLPLPSEGKENQKPPLKHQKTESSRTPSLTPTLSLGNGE
jgi:hypothetical protein